MLDETSGCADSNMDMPIYTERSKNPYWAERQDKTEDSIGLSMLSVSENLPEISIIA